MVHGMFLGNWPSTSGTELSFPPTEVGVQIKWCNLSTVLKYEMLLLDGKCFAQRFMTPLHSHVPLPSAEVAIIKIKLVLTCS